MKHTKIETRALFTTPKRLRILCLNQVIEEVGATFLPLQATNTAAQSHPTSLSRPMKRSIGTSIGPSTQT